MTIKFILDEIKNESSTKLKMEILRKYKDNELLQRVLVLANSARVKFYIRQIPEYGPEFKTAASHIQLSEALDLLDALSNRVVRGNDASDYLRELLSNLNPDDAYIIKRIIDKDLKAGIGVTNINKVIPKLIDRTPYMGAKSFSERLVAKIFEDNPMAISQIKMDGRYCNAIIDGGHAHLLSRGGEQTYVGEAEFLKELEELDDCVLNGELTVDGYDRYTANGYVASVVDIEENREARGEEETARRIQAFYDKNGVEYSEILKKIRLTVWDRITLDEYFKKKSDREYRVRLDELIDIIEDHCLGMVSLVEMKVVTNYEEALEHFLEALDRGLEGTILKSIDGTWKDGKPAWQVKMKLEMNMDLRIIGFEYGTKGKKNEFVISTINCESSCGLLKTNPSGMKEATMKMVTENQDKLLGTIVEIRCCGLSQNNKGEWSTLHPSVVKFRDDKDTCDSLESAKEIEAMAKTLNNKAV